MINLVIHNYLENHTKTKIKSILIIGSGPIVIGQLCEFDYSGSQLSRSLREEGMRFL